MADDLAMTIAAWSPLAGGLLTGKYATSHPPTTARLGTPQPTQREQAIIQAVARAAAETGRTPAQVALAWVASRSHAVHPILGARTVDQLTESLGYLDSPLPQEVLDRLAAESRIERGFPAEFIEANQSWVFGAAANLDVGTY